MAKTVDIIYGGSGLACGSLLKNAFTVYRKMGKNTVKPLDYTRLKRYYNYMDSEIGLLPSPNQKERP
jgi:hypothetical protein